LGPDQLGHLVGMGSAADVGVDLLAGVFRLSDVAVGD
jgi:hypothetical protein